MRLHIVGASIFPMIRAQIARKNLPKSKKLLSLVKTSGGLIFEATKSPSHPDHFLSYLEMVEMAEQGNVTSFSKPNDTLVIGNL